MEAEPQTFYVGAASPHSRTLTPTAAVRPRPRLPPALSTRSRSIEHPTGGDATATTDGGCVDNLAGALSELGRTDFVRKYSRKSRQARSSGDSTAGMAASPTVDFDVRSAASSPVVPAASRYQHLRSPVLAGCDASGDVDLSADTSTKTDNYHNIPTQRDCDVPMTADEQRLVDQSRIFGISDGRRDVMKTSLEERSNAQLDAKSTDCDHTKQGFSSRTSTSPRAGAGLFRSDSDSSKVRSFTLRSLRPKTMTAVGQLPPQPQKDANALPPVPRGGVTAPLVGELDTAAANSNGSTDRSGVETDDEGVGAVDLDEPCFKDTYLSVTTAGSGSASSNRSALLPNLQEYRDTHILPGNGMGPTRGRHQRSAEHSGLVTETLGTTGAVSASIATTQKTNSGGRFLTHPPLRERSVTREPGSVDSNGLGALRGVSDPTKQTLCLASQISVSSADSHICPSEDSTSLSYFGGDGNVESDRTAATADASSSDQLVRKNSKTQKQKSRSDPIRGEKNGDSSVVDIPSIVSGTMHAQSSPVLLDQDDDDLRRQQSSTTQFPFTTDSASDLSDRSGGGAGGNDGVTTSRYDNHVVASVASGNSAQSSLASMQDVAVRVVLKSDDSFEELRSTSIKPPRPKATKKRPRAPPSPLTTPVTIAAGETSSSASSLVRKVFSKDRNSGSSMGGRLQTKDGGSELELSATASTSSLTIPLSKKSSLLRSHSSVGSEAVSGASGSGGTAASARSKHAELPQSLVVGRQRSPGAPDAADVTVPRKVGVTASASVPELCDGDRLQHNSTTTSFTPSLEPVLSSSTCSLFDGPAGVKEKRNLIMQEFYTTEQQYVEALQLLVEKYMIPMKTQNVVDSCLVDEIFYKINEIYMHHATFIAFLARAMHDSSTTIGDVINKNFSKQTVIDSYISFIEHFPRAEKVLDEVSTKSSFQKFVEQCERDAGVKLPLKAQIVKPAQRIPRYELLLKRILDNTPAKHPDHEQLRQAEKTIHQLALRINSVKESKHEEDLQETLRKLELLLITDLAAADRLYLRHDLVTIPTRKDQQYCLWLFSDIALISCIKRKPTSVSRRTSILLQSPNGHDFIENTKHKLWLKVALDDVEITHVDEEVIAKQLAEKQQLESDVELLSQIIELSSKLITPHELIDEATQETFGHVNKQLTENQLNAVAPDAHSVDLVISSQEDLVNITLQFPNIEKKTSWEAAFAAAKQKLVQENDERPPEFIQSLQITKTRAGMQFSCAALTEPDATSQAGKSNSSHGGGSEREVWVCNSDGYVGHMCLLSLQSEPIVTLNTPVPGCNSRITCICAAPPAVAPQPHRPQTPTRLRKLSRRRRSALLSMQTPQIRIDELKDESEDGYASDSTSDSASELDYGDTEDTSGQPSPPSHDVAAEASLHSRSSSVDSSTQLSSQQQQQHSRHSTPTSTPSDDLTTVRAVSSPKDGSSMDAGKSTMWLGTEDGCVQIFASAENIKTTKSRRKLQQSAGVLSILYYGQRVYISLANGDLVVYKRSDNDGSWDCSDPDLVISVSNSAAPVNRMLIVSGKLWCACLNDVIVLSVPALNVESKFTAISSSESKRGVQCMSWCGLGVWLAAQGSFRVLLFHASTYDQLLEINVGPAVAQKLQMADDIIRQHKMACLRVTALLACRDRLWVGTSAGVILTLPLPKLTATSTKATVSSPTVTGLFYGHTGHVRFLTSVELGRSVTQPPTTGGLDVAAGSTAPRRHATFSGRVASSTPSSGGGGGGQRYRPTTPPLPSVSATAPSAVGGSSLVISGGDGFEDFRASSTDNESAGRDDSTNHLLLWRI